MVTRARPSLRSGHAATPRGVDDRRRRRHWQKRHESRLVSPMRELERDLPTSATAQLRAIELPALTIVGAGPRRRLARRRGRSAPASSARLAGTRRGPPRHAATPRRCCSASPTRRSAAAAAEAAGAARSLRLRRPHQRRDRPRRARRRRRRRRRDLLAAPAADDPRRPHRLHRLSLRDLGLEPGGARVRPRARRAARRCGRSRSHESDRAAYHAAASIASNFLVTLEESAAELLAAAGVEDARELLAPLVLRTAANWAERGGAALTGPIAAATRRPCAGTSRRSAETAPELVGLYEALAAAHAGDRRGEARAHQVGAARRARAGAPGGPRDRPGADDGSPARRPSGAARGGPRALRPGRDEPVREPDAVRTRRGPRLLPARRGSRRRARRAGGRRLRLRPGSSRTSIRTASRPASRSPAG